MNRAVSFQWSALVGGIFIGLSASLLLFTTGRVAGISGILRGIVTPHRGDFLWRLFFLFGLIFGGWVLNQISSEFFKNTFELSHGMIITAGLLVGFGTVLGSGCTSGHGVCGLSRLSLRSAVATVTFIFAGVLTVYFLRKFGVLP